MARLRAHLRKAPIVEAVIDFRVTRQHGIDSRVFEGVGSKIKEKYPKQSKLQSIEAKFGFQPGKVVEPSQTLEQMGYRFDSLNNEIAQFRVDGFTFSKLEPYSNWNEVFTEAYRLWEMYVQAARPKQVDRVAVRYINRMFVEQGTDLKDVLEAPPTVPVTLPQAIGDFLTRVVVEDTSRQSAAVIVQALERSPASNSVLLDIDAFRVVSTTPDDPELRNIFEQLRQLKNDIFFGSITEARTEIYE